MTGCGSGQTVLVTGAAGYIGTTLCQDLLNEGYHVIGVDNLIFGNGSALAHIFGHPDFEFYQHDVRAGYEKDWVRRADIVVPLAALVGAPLCSKRESEAWDVNAKAVEDLVGQLSLNQLPIVTNTNSGYGVTDGLSECTEDSPLRPISVYGRSKCAGEKAVLEHPAGTSLRLATVFGVSPRMRLDLMVNNFVAGLLKIGAIMLFGSPETERHRFFVYEPHFCRNFVHVRDVSRAVRWAIANEDMNGIYNCGHPLANRSKLELAHTVCDRLSIPRELVVVGDGKDEDARNYRVSNKRILKTGFRFHHGLEEGIDEVAHYLSLLTPEQTRGMSNV